jgi:hypothetical protein
MVPTREITTGSGGVLNIRVTVCAGRRRKS